jgi:formaldehyde-activating enzyme involved in methanogenesis
MVAVFVESLNEINPSLLPRPTNIIHPNVDILEDAEVEIMYLPPQDANISGVRSQS